MICYQYEPDVERLLRLCCKDPDICTSFLAVISRGLGRGSKRPRSVIYLAKNFASNELRLVKSSLAA